MGEFGPVLLFGVFVVVGGLFAYLGWKAAKERRAAFAALAAQRGWVWTERDDSWTERFGGDPFGIGADHKARNVLTGDYHVTRLSHSYDLAHGHRTAFEAERPNLGPS